MTINKCTNCNRVLDEAKIMWLELSNTDGKYYRVLPKDHISQGCFPFGDDCANIFAHDLTKSEAIKYINEKLVENNHRELSEKELIDWNIVDGVTERELDECVNDYLSDIDTENCADSRYKEEQEEEQEAFERELN